MIEVPCAAAYRAASRPRRRSPAPRARPRASASGRARPGSARRTGRRGRGCRGRRSGRRLWNSTSWRYDVPVLGVPTCRRTLLGHRRPPSVGPLAGRATGAADRRTEQHPHGQREHPFLVGRRDPGPLGRLGQVAVDSVVTGGEPPTEVARCCSREPRVGSAAGTSSGGPGCAARTGRRRCHISAVRRSGVTRVPTHRRGTAGQLDRVGRERRRHGRAGGAADAAGAPGAGRRAPRAPGRRPTRRHPGRGERRPGRSAAGSARSAYLGRAASPATAGRRRRATRAVQTWTSIAVEVGAGDHDGRRATARVAGRRRPARRAAGRRARGRRAGR